MANWQPGGCPGPTKKTGGILDVVGKLPRDRDPLSCRLKTELPLPASSILSLLLQDPSLLELAQPTCRFAVSTPVHHNGKLPSFLVLSLEGGLLTAPPGQGELQTQLDAPDPVAGSIDTQTC